MRKMIAIACAVLLLSACGKKDHDTQPEDNNAPAAATLLFPGQNEVCTTGQDINDAQSSVTFTWKAASKASSYDLVLKNLLTGTEIAKKTTDVKQTLTLNRSTPYSWYLVSKSTASDITAQSETWKFYNSGPGVVSYAPFPADLIVPAYGAVVSGSTVKFSWTGSTVANGTILNYDLYFSTSTNPSLYKANITEPALDGVPIISKTTYYWKIVTHGPDGNTSYSQTSQFSAN